MSERVSVGLIDWLVDWSINFMYESMIKCKRVNEECVGWFDWFLLDVNERK